MNKIFIIALVLVMAASLLASNIGEEAVKTTTCEPTSTCETTTAKTATCEPTTVKTETCESATAKTSTCETATDKTTKCGTETLKVSGAETSVPKITFLELGSTTCIPCKKMKPVLKSISEKYGDQIKVEFIDLNKDRDAAKKYEVRMMPTQVFLNEKGEEIHRHVGYYPEEQIDEFLQNQGLTLEATK